MDRQRGPPAPYAGTRTNRRSVRLNSRPVAGTACGSAFICCMSRGVRARNSTGVPSDVCVLVRSGTTISRISESRTPAPPSTDRRSSILPGGASKRHAARPARGLPADSPAKRATSTPARCRARVRGKTASRSGRRPSAPRARAAGRPARRIAGRARRRLPHERHARLAVLAARGANPGANDARRDVVDVSRRWQAPP